MAGLTAQGEDGQSSPLQKDLHPAQGVSRLAHSPGQMGSYAQCALRGLDLRALMRNRTDKNETGVENLS